VTVFCPLPGGVLAFRIVVRGTSEPLPGDNRRFARAAAIGTARLKSGDLTLPGTLQNVGAGGVFLSTHLLIEIGEQGVLTVATPDGEIAVRVQVVWIRYSNHLDGPGMGLRFEDDPAEFLAATRP